MNTSPADSAELISAIKEAHANLRNRMSLLDEARINTVPFKDSWTVGQLVNHVTKATTGLSGMLRAEGVALERDPAARIQELKDTFLDYTRKMKSPDFITPDEGPYKKEASLASLDEAFEALQAGAAGAELNALVTGLPLGPLTKHELLHFVLYHTIRHTHQMQKICDTLETM